MREYLMEGRRDEFVRQFCRKLLGFSLGRAVRLSDKPLIDDMMSGLEADGYRFGIALEKLVTSKQFTQIRVAGDVRGV